MSVPPFVPFGPPPLPQGWTEHTGPGGQLYYYNIQSKESTYVRPLPPFYAPGVEQTQKKKEKPLTKTQIPGTDWLRIKTTEGNIFYSHKVNKTSLWTVPDDIRDAVEALDRETQEKDEQAKRDKLAKRTAGKTRVEQAEVEKVLAEVQQDTAKRKAGEDASALKQSASKKPRIEEEVEEDEESDESEEEEWQKEAAAQLEAEAEAETERRRKEEEKQKTEERRLREAQINMPARVDLSLDEAKALFKTLLREKDVNPLHPWDTSLPLFVSDPRYVLLPSVSARREAFDEYCRDRARELRQMNVKKDKETASPKEEFDQLLATEVKSTRASWSEFRRTWKKDRRFYSWGRDDREREKRFREYLKELGEKKRLAAQQAEENFFALLKENGPFQDGACWKDIKRKLTHDPRYDAVGSSSLREELFNTFLKATLNESLSVKPDVSEAQGTDNPTESRQERKERAVKEREAKVRAERERVEASIGKSRQDLNKEEGEREFKTLLTDAVREPQVTWERILPQLQTDPRFTHSHLPLNQQLHLFHSHVVHLRLKHVNDLHSLFEAHAPSLVTTFKSMPIDSLASSLPATKLGFDGRALENEFMKWQKERSFTARKAFDEMLAENSFVEFWGRLGKIGGEGVDGGVKADEDEMADDEGEGQGGKVDMKALAKNVDVQEIEKVLKNDKRYIVFEHLPEQRERWIRDYLSQLSAPKLSVHIPA